MGLMVCREALTENEEAQRLLAVPPATDVSASLARKEAGNLRPAIGCELKRPEAAVTAMVAEVVDADVAELCDRSGRPRCHFEISSRKNS